MVPGEGGIVVSLCLFWHDGLVDVSLIFFVSIVAYFICYTIFIKIYFTSYNVDIREAQMFVLHYV